ncbi:hypothetical protein [Nonomuraea sp. NPDC048916]|uniref:hypothetical protein n=1 Tax=Nonomuraea sp. NPDC048916 TaxID=3154232 RepID=UPI0033F1474C
MTVELERRSGKNWTGSGRRDWRLSCSVIVGVDITRSFPFSIFSGAFETCDLVGPVPHHEVAGRGDDHAFRRRFSTAIRVPARLAELSCGQPVRCLHPCRTVEESPMYLRVAIALQTLAVFTAPITAGLLLSSPDGRTLHSVSAYGVFTAAVLHLITAISVWRPGGGSPRPILYAVAFLGLTLAQIALGIAQVMTLHVPLGVLMFGMSVLQLSQVLADRRTHLVTAGQRGGHVHAAHPIHLEPVEKWSPESSSVVTPESDQRRQCSPWCIAHSSVSRWQSSPTAANRSRELPSERIPSLAKAALTGQASAGPARSSSMYGAITT